MAHLPKSQQFTQGLLVDDGDLNVSPWNPPIKGYHGAVDGTGRYTGLKLKLDAAASNQNWRLLETRDYPTSQSELSFLDLFSGAGGMSVGFSEAGWRKLLSVERDSSASATIRRNFPTSVHFEGSIESLTEDTLYRAIDGQSVQVVCGGPPCQGFSVAGKRALGDSRNGLFHEYLRIVRLVQPDYVVLENVPGIVTIGGGGVLREILKGFADAGYPDMSVRILEAAEFGIPQLRARAVLIGNRLGRANPYPIPWLDRAHYRSIESAIEDLQDTPRNRALNHEWTNHSPTFIKRLACVPPGGSLYPSFRDAWKRQYLGVPAMTVKENHGGVGIHPNLPRVLSVRECARLQTFPDTYLFAGSMKRGYWQVGNAVPCILARQIALAIRIDLADQGRGTTTTGT